MAEAAGGEALALYFLQFPQSGTDDFAGIVVAAGFNQLADEAIPMGGKCDVHDGQELTSNGQFVKSWVGTSTLQGIPLLKSDLLLRSA